MNVGSGLQNGRIEMDFMLRKRKINLESQKILTVANRNKNLIYLNHGSSRLWNTF